MSRIVTLSWLQMRAIDSDPDDEDVNLARAAAVAGEPLAAALLAFIRQMSLLAHVQLRGILLVLRDSRADAIAPGNSGWQRLAATVEPHDDADAQKLEPLKCEPRYTNARLTPPRRRTK